MDVTAPRWSEAIYIWASVYVNLTSVDILQGMGVYLNGWSVEHYSTHVMDNVLVGGESVAYFVNMNSWSIDNWSVGQLIIANCSDFTISNANVTKYTSIIAYSNNGRLANSHFYKDIEIKDSSNMSIENSIVDNSISMWAATNVTVKNSVVGWEIWIDGYTLENFVTHTIVNVTDSWGRPILQLKDITGPATITPANVKQLIITNVSNVDINMNRHYVGYVLIAGSQDVTFRNTSSYLPWEIGVYFSNRTTIKNIEYTDFLNVERSAEVILENITMNWISIRDTDDVTIYNSKNRDLWLWEDSNVAIYNNILSQISVYSGNVRIYQNKIFPQEDWQRDWGTGLYIDGWNVTVASNVISGFYRGIEVGSWAENVLIYDNLLNNTVNFESYGSVVQLNTTKKPGRNIVGGPYLGGNFWASPDGTGFSETCTDSDMDGICDAEYWVDYQNVDYLPLAKPPAGEKAPVWELSLNGSVTAFSAAESAPVYAVGLDDGRLTVISPWKSSKIVWTTTLDSPVTAVKVNKYGNYILAGTANGTLYYFDISSNKPKFTLNLNSPVKLVDVSGAEGKHMIAVTLDNKLYYIYKLAVNKVRFSVQLNDDVTVARISEEGMVIIAGTEDGKVYYYYTPYKSKIVRYWDVGAPVTAISGTPSYEWFAVGTANGTVHYINRWLPQNYVKLLASFDSPVTALKAAPAFKSTRVVAGTDAGEVYYIDKSTSEVVQLLTVSEPVISVDVDITANFVAVGTPNAVYYIGRGSSKLLWTHLAGGGWIAMGPEGFSVVTVSPTGDFKYFISFN